MNSAHISTEEDGIVAILPVEKLYQIRTRSEMPEIIPNLHPVFVHFTVALLSLLIGLFIVLHLFGSHLPENLRQQLRAVAAGFYAYNTVAHDVPSHAVMTDHRNWALAMAPLFIGIALWLVVSAWRGKALGGRDVTAAHRRVDAVF